MSPAKAAPTNLCFLYSCVAFSTLAVGGVLFLPGSGSSECAGDPCTGLTWEFSTNATTYCHLFVDGQIVRLPGATADDCANDCEKAHFAALPVARRRRLKLTDKQKLDSTQVTDFYASTLLPSCGGPANTACT